MKSLLLAFALFSTAAWADGMPQKVVRLETTGQNNTVTFMHSISGQLTTVGLCYKYNIRESIPERAIILDLLKSALVARADVDPTIETLANGTQCLGAVALLGY